MAGVSAADTAAARKGVPPIDSLNQQRVLASTHAAAVRTEVPLSSNALILDGLKLVLASPRMRLGMRGRRPTLAGFWTAPTWPTHEFGTLDPNRTHGMQADPGCAASGCLFNLSAGDLVERHDLSGTHLAALQHLRSRLAEHLRERFVSNYSDPRYQKCISLRDYVSWHSGFAGPVCSRGHTTAV